MKNKNKILFFDCTPRNGAEDSRRKKKKNVRLNCGGILNANRLRIISLNPIHFLNLRFLLLYRCFELHKLDQ